MHGDEARVLLGFLPTSRPTLSQVKAAYKRKVWESHPDLFPLHQKPLAESKFKLVSEAYIALQSGASASSGGSYNDSYYRVVRTGVPKTQGGRVSRGLIMVPFLLIIGGTITLGSINATRAYKRQKEAYPSHNPFLP